MSATLTTEADAMPAPRPTLWIPYAVLLVLLWGWAVGIDSFFWRTNENYSYGWVVPPLMLFFLWRRVQSRPLEFWRGLREGTARVPSPPGWLLAFAALAAFPLEVLRSEYHQSGIVLWGINAAAIGASLFTAYYLGGVSLVRWIAFPVLFYLTAVPWPAKMEGPLVQGMMQTVAQVVSEALLWMGVPVKTDGAVLHLTNGPVGIVEACSGIRSLQSGLMVCLAVAELSGLRPVRRWLLVGVTVGLALVTNFARTFALCWIMEHDGDKVMHERHDLIGNIAMYSLYALIWGAGQLLSLRGGGGGDEWPAPGQGMEYRKFRWLTWDRLPDVRGLVAGIGVMLLAVHGWYAVLRASTQPQLSTQFRVRSTNEVPGLEVLKFDEYVWGKLGADEGDTVRLASKESPVGVIGAYHLFWRPSERSKTALHHRPDSCMPGSGWAQVGEPSPVEVEVGGHRLQFMAFEFRRSDVRAVQLWGVWRNGEPVRMDYSSRLTALPEVYGWLPSSRHMKGVELVSCFVPFVTGTPPVELAARSIQRIFEFRPFQGGIAKVP